MSSSESDLKVCGEVLDLLYKQGLTSEERYKILEERDRLFRLRNPKVKVRVELAVRLTGTCSDMCPEKERYMREVQRQLSMYEFIPGRDFEVDHKTAVKAYSRSSADQEEPLPYELRSGAGLELTINYLLHNIIERCESEDENLAEWYNFVWDRTRGLRKEITQQQLCDLPSVSLMEKCARFHIFCASRLCQLDRNAFVSKLNDENLMKCLQSLEHMYTDLQLQGIQCPNEPEFRAYQILMNLNDAGDILWEIQQKSEWVYKSAEVQLAIKIHLAIFSQNFVRFFRLVREASFMAACILHRYFYQVRINALKAIVKAHSLPPNFEAFLNISPIQQMLGYGPNMHDDFVSFCAENGIVCDNDTQKVFVGKKQLSIPENPTIVVRRELDLIDSKLTIPVSEAINGSPLGSNPMSSYVPESSFDKEGCLIDRSHFEIPKSVTADRKPLTPVSALAQPNQAAHPLRVPLTRSLFQVAFNQATASVESELDGKIRSRSPVPLFQHHLTPIAALQQPKYDPGLIEEMVQEKVRDVLDLMQQTVIDEIKEVAKGAIFTCASLKQAEAAEQELNLIQNSISSALMAKIVHQVVKNDVRDICTDEINTTRDVIEVTSAIESKLVANVLRPAVLDASLLALSEIRRTEEENEKTACTMLHRVVLAYWFNLWRRNIVTKKEDQRTRLEKRYRELENLPPTLSQSFTLDNIRRLSPNFKPLDLNMSRIPNEASSLDVINDKFANANIYFIQSQNSGSHVNRTPSRKRRAENSAEQSSIASKSSRFENMPMNSMIGELHSLIRNLKQHAKNEKRKRVVRRLQEFHNIPPTLHQSLTMESIHQSSPNFKPLDINLSKVPKKSSTIDALERKFAAKQKQPASGEDTSGVLASSRCEKTPITSLLDGLHDFIRDVQKEKAIPLYPDSTTNAE